LRPPNLIGKYSNLDVQKVVAISHTDYSESARQKAGQHNIELLTLQEALATDWVAKVGPDAFQFFGFRNRPMIVGLHLNGVEKLKIEYTFEGEVKAADASTQPFADFILEMWHAYATRLASKKISEYAFSNWKQISSSPNTPRYCEIVESSKVRRTIRIGTSQPIEFDTIVWGVGTKYTTETINPTTWKLGDKTAALATAFSNQEKPVHVTLVADSSGRYIRAEIDVQ
jgi:hypothetical protein